MSTKKTTRKPRQKVDRSDETKAQKFKRLGEARVTKCVMALRNLAKLGGINYERTADQQKKIADTLKAEVALVEKALVPFVPGAAKIDKSSGPAITL